MLNLRETRGLSLVILSKRNISRKRMRKLKADKLYLNLNVGTVLAPSAFILRII